MTNPTESDVDAGDDIFPVSRAAFQSIMDRLQRLDSEVSSLKPQVEGLHAENQALKHEIEELRGHKREALSSGPSVSAPQPGEPDFRLRSKSLSYASEPHSTPVREGTQLAGNVAGPSHANTIVVKVRVLYPLSEHVSNRPYRASPLLIQRYVCAES
jgi:FtsZ-binding cell division protein ZapB